MLGNQEYQTHLSTEAQVQPLAILGIFGDHHSAEEGFKVLKNHGYGKDDYHVIMSEATRNELFGTDAFANKNQIKENHPKEVREVIFQDAAIGAGIGGTVGAILGAIAAIGTSVVVPGLGLVIAGPLAAGLVTATGLGVGGGVVGAVFGFEVPDQHTKIEEGIKSGNIILGIHPKTTEEGDSIEREWRNIANLKEIIR